MAKKKKSSKKNSGSNGSKESGNSRPSPSSWFCFTFFDYSSEDIIRFQAIAGQYVFQQEICPDTGKKHLQGTVKFTSKKRLTTVNKLFPHTHWECCKNIRKAIEYCSKEDTRVANSTVYTNMKLPKSLKTLTTLRPWQQELYNVLQQPSNDRTINWYWEKKGNVGKSAFARYMVIKHNAFYICGTARDMKCGLASVSEKNYGWFPELIILDIPRDSIGCSYKGLEQIKNGIFYSTKYESGMLVFNPPHIVVFANEEPDIERMSSDRWNIVNIDINKPKPAPAQLTLTRCLRGTT